MIVTDNSDKANIGAVAFSAEQNHAQIKTTKKTAFAIGNTLAKAVFR